MPDDAYVPRFAAAGGFLESQCFGFQLSVLWIGLYEEWGALVGALLDVGLFNGGTAVWLWIPRWGAAVSGRGPREPRLSRFWGPTPGATRLNLLSLTANQRRGLTTRTAAGGS